MSIESDLADKTVDRIRPLLAGIGPDVQGAALLQLVSMFVAGHHPSLRDEQIEIFVSAVREMVPVYDRLLYPQGFPENLS